MLKVSGVAFSWWTVFSLRANAFGTSPGIQQVTLIELIENRSNPTESMQFNILQMLIDAKLLLPVTVDTGVLSSYILS